MTGPSSEQFSRIHQRIDAWEELPSAAIERELVRMEEEGEDPLVISYIKLHFKLPLASESAVRFAPGDQVGGRYTICGHLGSGGMGVVYRATQDLTQRDVALKVIHPQLACDELLQRFRDEIRMLARLSHPSIVQIYDAGTIENPQGGRPTIFCTMQLVEGRSVHRFVAETDPSTDDIIRLIARICDAVQYAHDCGVVHRDLKPGNILVDAKGCPYLLDFGLAQAADMATGYTISEWSMAGTPRYMSPELFLGEAPLGAKTPDVYALGVIAFELLSGDYPYEIAPGVSVAELRDLVLRSEPRRLTEAGGRRQHQRSDLDAVVAKALRKDAASRYLSAAAFAKALLGCIEHHRLVVQDWKPVQGQPVPATEWLLERQIGSGGVGEVWLAQHASLGLRVFKFCTDVSKLRSLKREKRLYQLLNQSPDPHHRWVRLYDVSLDDPPYYLSMEYIEGGDLQGWSTHQGGITRIPLEVRLEIVAQAAEALAVAHEAGVLHCDIKPGNLLIRQRAEGGNDLPVQVYVSDFGIGQLSLDAPRPAVTRGVLTRPAGGGVSSQAGTQLYMAPEVVAGDTPSISSDIYSLGVVLFQLVVGDFRRAVTIDWDRFITDPLLADDLRRCLAGSGDDRFPAAIELARSLRTLEKRRQEQLLVRERIERRERQAYRRGILRASGVSAMVIAVVAVLAVVAFRESRVARRATSEARLGEALVIARSGQAGFKARGLELIREMRGYHHEPVAFRNAAAALLASWDLRPVAPVSLPPAAVASALPSISDPAESNRNARVIAFSADGVWRAGSRSGGSVDLEHVRTRVTSVLYSEGSGDPFVPESREASALAFAPDSTVLAWASRQSLHVQLWETGAAGGRLRTSLYHPAPVEALTWLNPDRLVTACQDGHLYVWELRDRRVGIQDKPELKLRVQGEPQHLALCADGRVFVSVDRQGRGIVWESDRLTAVRRFKLDRVPDQLTPTARGFAIRESGRPPVEWVVEPSLCFREKPIGITADVLQFDATGKWLAVVAGGRVGVLDRALVQFESRTIPLARSVAWTTQGEDSVLLAGSRNGPRSLVVSSTPGQLNEVESPWPVLNRDGPLSVGAPGMTVVAQGDQLAFIRSNRAPQFLLKTPWPVDHLRLSADALHIALGNTALREIKIWSLRAEQFVATVTNAPGWGEFDRRGRWWAGGANGGVTVRDTTTWAERSRVRGMHPPGLDPLAVAFSPEGDLLFVLSPDFQVMVVRVSDGELLVKLEAPVVRRGHALAVAPDSGQLMVSCDDGFLQTWDMAELERELTEFGLRW